MESFKDRRTVIALIFLSVGVVFLFRLFYVQVLNDRWNIEAQEVSKVEVITIPARGLIYDRNNELLAANQPTYNLYLVGKELKISDTSELARLAMLDEQELKYFIDSATRYKNSNITFLYNIEQDKFMQLVEKLHNFEGIYGSINTSRSYPKKIASHALGYIREVNANDIKKDAYYKAGDLIGVKGIERYYENEIRGKKGVSVFLRDAFGKLKSSVSTDSAKTGYKIITTIDSKLQEYGERLMQKKMGSIVAIEPSTGEILALISAPNYDPNELAGQKLRNSTLFGDDTLKPLFNRAVKSKYPPGSIFKMVQGLIALDLKAIDVNTSFPCDKELVGCHGHPRARNIVEAIKYSCNPYFYQTFKNITYVVDTSSSDIFEKSRVTLNVWREYVKSFGIGDDIQVDLPYYSKGSLPTDEYYDKNFSNRWSYRTFSNLSIGQGAMEVTPLQMANLAAIIANRGYFYYPHLVKSVGSKSKNDKYLQKRFTKVNQVYFEPIVNAMQEVIEGDGGTAKIAKIDGITVCGKTGTAQNPHGEDHSVFIAFAPKENPKIAIAVYIENAGWGGSWAAPTASLMIEKYLTDTITNSGKEQRILNADLIPSFKK